MKLSSTILATAIILLVTSCTKQDKGADIQTVELQSSVATGTSIGRYSVVHLSLGTDASKTVTWSSKPDTAVYIWSSGNTARVQFLSKGTYQITGTLGNTAGSSSFTVRDTAVLTPSTVYKDIQYAANEELVLTARKLGDTLNSGGVQIGGYTKEKYACGSWAKFSSSISNNTLTIFYTGLIEPFQPCNTAPAVVYTGGGSIGGMVAGLAYQLVIHFKGQVYTGSIMRTDAGKFFITWSYTSGVKISPLSF